MKKMFNYFYFILLIHILFWISAPRLPYPNLVPEKIELTNLFKYIDFNQIIISLGITLLIALLCILICLLFCIPISLMITQDKTRFFKTISIILYLPILAPLLLPAIGLYEFFLKLDITGNIFSVALAQSCILYPYMLKPIEDFLKTNGFKYKQIAKDLGANRFEILIKVLLPSMKEPIKLGSFFVLIGSFNDYIISFLIGDLQIKTLSVLLYPLMQSDNRMTSTFIIIIYTLPLVLISYILSYKKTKAQYA